MLSSFPPSFSCDWIVPQKEPAHGYSFSIADLAKFEHTFCKKEQIAGAKDILCKKLGAIHGGLCYTEV
jgi:hypothetical protein